MLALHVAARDPRTPLSAKLVAGATAAYALSPIDLIPDFIPVLGLIDDLLIVPPGIWLAIRLIPAGVYAEHRAAAATAPPAAIGRWGAGMVLVLWAVMLIALGVLLLR